MINFFQWCCVFFLWGFFFPICPDFRPLRKTVPSKLAVVSQLVRKTNKIRVFAREFDKWRQCQTLSPGERINIHGVRTLVFKIQFPCILLLQSDEEPFLSYGQGHEENLDAIVEKNKELFFQQKCQKGSFFSFKDQKNESMGQDIFYRYNKKGTTMTVSVETKKNPLKAFLSLGAQHTSSPLPILVIKVFKGKNIVLEGNQISCVLDNPQGKKFVCRGGNCSLQGMGHFFSWEISTTQGTINLYGLKGAFKACLNKGTIHLGFSPLKKKKHQKSNGGQRSSDVQVSQANTENSQNDHSSGSSEFSSKKNTPNRSSFGFRGQNSSLDLHITSEVQGTIFFPEGSSLYGHCDILRTNHGQNMEKTQGKESQDASPKKSFQNYYGPYRVNIYTPQNHGMKICFYPMGRKSTPSGLLTS